MTQQGRKPNMAPVTPHTPPASPRRLSYVRLSSIRPAGRNPKRHDVDHLVGLIQEHGFVDIPEADSRTDQLVGGHGRIEALVYLREHGQPPPEGILTDDDGEWLVPIIEGWQSRSTAQAEAVGVGLNEATARGGWDQRELAAVLEDVLLRSVGDPPGPGTPDTPPPAGDGDTSDDDEDEDEESFDNEPRGDEISCPKCHHVFTAGR